MILFLMPVHPLVVHIPIAFIFFATPLSLGVFLFNRKNTQKSLWWLVVVWQFFLTASIYAALATGEIDKEKVQKIQKAEYILAEHEEAAELLFFLNIIVFLGTLLAYKPVPVQKFLQIAVILFQVGITVYCIQVAHLGARLVYEYGAADVHRDTNSRE